MSNQDAKAEQQVRRGAVDVTFLRAHVHRVVEIPLAGKEEALSGDPFADQRMGALAALFHSGRIDSSGFVWGWQRPGASGPIELFTSEPGLAPPGSKLVPAPGSVDTLVNTPSWVVVAIRPVGTISESGKGKPEPGNHAGRVSSASLESVLLRMWEQPFTLMVYATPVTPTEAEDAGERVGSAARFTGQRKETNPDMAVACDQLSWWHREILHGASSGLWWVRLLAGGATDQDARALAGMAASSFPIRDVGYELVPDRPGFENRLSFASSGNDQATDNRGEHGFLAGTPLLSKLTRPPSVEVPGIRQALQSSFDTTSEHTDGERGADPAIETNAGVNLGSILDGRRREAGRMVIPYSSLNRHALIPGATGSGKSVTGRTIAEELITSGIPVTVIEPAKAEWATGLASRLPAQRIVRIAPGDPDGIACCIDPMRPIDGFSLQTHIDLVKSLFLAAFDADEPFPQVLSAALQRSYQDQGWHTLLSKPLGGKHASARYPTLADLQASARQVVDEIGYGPEVHQNIQGFVKVRLSSLRLGTSGRFLEGGHPLDMGKLLASNVVFEIQDVGDDAEKAFIIGAFLLKLTEHYRVAEKRGQIPRDKLRHVTIIEEAHRLLRNPEGHAGAANNAVELFASMLAEVRAYGEGIIVAEQIPSKLIQDTIKNSSVKIAHRLPAKDDRDVVGATMNLSDEQSEFLVTVRPGEAAVFTDGMDRPVLVRIPDTTMKERNALASPADCDELIEPTFGRCAANYGTGGLTLTTVARAQQRIRSNPVLCWWIELAVLAHLTGWAMPLPDIQLHEKHDLDELRATLACAVDDAVASRSAVIRERVSPVGLAEHVTDVMFGLITKQVRCAAEPEWVAEPFTWDRVYADLLDHRETHPDRECNLRHPYSAGWEAYYGRPVPGSTCREQLEAVRAWRVQSYASPEVEDIVFGLDLPSALERAVGLARSGPGWPEIVRRHLAGLDARWAERFLLTAQELSEQTRVYHHRTSPK